MKKETKIALTITAIGSAVIATTITTVKMLADIAIAKQLPRVANTAKKKINSELIGDEVYAIAAEYSKKLKCREHEKIIIQNREGTELVAHYFPAEKEKRLVIAMHGWRSSWSFDYGGVIDFLLDEGCSVIIAEQRCHGESGGEYIGFGVYERYDCLDWINYANDRFGNSIPIYLCGVSMGATTVLMAAGLELPNNVKGIIADCGFTSPREIWTHVMKNNLKISGKLAYPIANYYVSKKAGYDGEDASTVEAMKNCKVPILFVHGDADKFVPLEMTNKNHDACASDKKLLIVKGAAHGASYFKDTFNYQKLVKEMFDKYDK